MFAAGYCALTARASAAAVNVTTYHGDPQRTGWNARESLLNPTTVSSASFGQVGNVVVDAQIDAQPLYVAGQSISGQGTHNVVYVATENNSIYAIDGDTGTVLLQKNLGTPVPWSALPGQCTDNSHIVGITATPVIDVAAQVIYIVAYTYEGGAPVYRVHALDLGSLTDKLPPVVIAAVGTLSPTKTKYVFDPSVARARVALLLSHGRLYAAFGSFCDQRADVARGWVLGWQAASLTPLLNADLVDRQSTSQNSFFLSAVWMSGFGITADSLGRLFFVTGNSDPSGTTFQPPYGLAESVIKMTPDLSTVLSYFTPAGAGVSFADLEAGDQDFGSGGVTLLQRQPGNYPRLAVAAGKAGIMYLMNADSLGGHNLGSVQPDNVLGEYRIGSCFCGASYFRGTDGVGRVVSSGGSNVTTWKLYTGGATPRLGVESKSGAIGNGENAGFFTTISSNGVQANSQIIWAIGRPLNRSPGTINLYAFDPSNISSTKRMARLFAGAAGTWPTGGYANLVPLVANGRVFVGSYQQLAIFGIKNGATARVAVGADQNAATNIDTEPALPGHSIYGVLVEKTNSLLKLRTRSGKVITVDLREATKTFHSVVPVLGGALLVRGDYDREGVLRARSILRAKSLPALWGQDN
jgi:outer membrane protein assembly factor BamB